MMLAEQGKVSISDPVSEYLPDFAGGERDLVEGVKLGTMKLTMTSTGPLSAFNPMMKLVDLPYLFTSAQQAYKVLDGPIGRQILDEFDKSGILHVHWRPERPLVCPSRL